MTQRIQAISTLTIYLACRPNWPVRGFRDDNGELRTGTCGDHHSRVLLPADIHRTAREYAVDQYQPLPVSREQLRQENRVFALFLLIAIAAAGLRFGWPEPFGAFHADPIAASATRG